MSEFINLNLPADHLWLEYNRTAFKYLQEMLEDPTIIAIEESPAVEDGVNMIQQTIKVPNANYAATFGMIVGTLLLDTIYVK